MRYGDKKLETFWQYFLRPYMGIILVGISVLYLLLELYALYHQTVNRQQQRVDHTYRLIHTNTEGHDWLGKWALQVEIITLPVYRADRNAWYFTIVPKAVVERHELKSLPQGFPRKIRLAWYQSFHQSSEINHHKDYPKQNIPQLGEHWRLFVKLKPIHSWANLGSFDYEKWAFVNRIESRGYVIQNKNKPVFSNERVATKPAHFIHRWREYLRQSIEKRPISAQAKALLRALMIGDKSSLTDEQWQSFRETGLSHVLAISGLHIGLVALFMGWLCSGLWRQSAYLCRLLPAPYIWYVGGLLSATIYALLTGFEIPVQRALVMLAMTFFALLWQRYIPNTVILLLAFIAVMLFDIRSFYATGFWLSFVCVALLIFLFRPHQEKQKNASFFSLRLKKSLTVTKIFAIIWSRVMLLFQLQVAITLCLIPLLLFFFQSASVISPLANLTLTPLIILIIIPAIIVAIFLSPFPTMMYFLLDIIGWMLGQLNTVIILMVQWLDIRVQLPALSIAMTVLVTVLFMLVFSRINRKKRVACLLIGLILLYPFPKRITEGMAEVHVLDVGQGLSVVIFTQNHSLIYDFGNRGVGRSVISPFMNAHMRKADRIIMSHHDIDHYGGAKYVLTQYPQVERINWQNCSGKWVWDKVHFALLQYPQSLGEKMKDNNLSCLLKVTANHGKRILISADIEKKVEHWLVKNKREYLESDVLLVPHQGSKTSSVQAFIQAVNPQIALVSAGFQNHFNHPHPQIVRRYQALNIPLLSTICGGTLSFVLGTPSEVIEVSEYRKNQGGFWLRQCLP